MESLKKVLTQEDTVLFIGSGVSLWSGLPSWNTMLTELADFIDNKGSNSSLVRHEAEYGDLLQAASYGFDLLTAQQVGEFIKQSCKYGIAKPVLIHEKIVTLGPTCFVTTNYDNLIEESVRVWLPNKFFRPPVTNRHLTETAEIVHARSSNFIFKPHGDAGDTESIILTREQYRKLLPGGERHSALETVKMLMASRPVVYIGFGLRDPDFLYLRDLLANTYKGGTRDHFAIMADVDPDQLNYWRNNYGIHLVNYDTQIDKNGNRVHDGLLALLSQLKVDVPEENKVPSCISEEFLPENILSLARHASRLSSFKSVAPELSIRVKLANSNQQNIDLPMRQNCLKYDGQIVDKILSTDGPEKAIITGLPGAGKSYSILKSTSIIADKLYKVCLEENFNEKDVLIPIYVDLKLYDGDINSLIEKTLPSNLRFKDLNERFKMKIFFDSFNEMPRSYIESGIYEKDIIKFMDSLKDSSVIIGSRTNDGLSKINFPNYCLENIDSEYIESELEKMDIIFDDRFRQENIKILQKPFLFSLFVNGKISLPESPNPIRLYDAYFDTILSSFSTQFKTDLDLRCCLSKVAFLSLKNGTETQPFQILLHFINTQITTQKCDGIDGGEVANWLVSKNVIIPYMHNKFAFFHQSITEYLAALDLAIMYKSNRDILKEVMENTRWDQALFFSLPLLDKENSVCFLSEVVNIDILLAIKASKFIEFDRNNIVSDLLNRLILRQSELGRKHDSYSHKIDFALTNDLIVSEVHEDLLYQIIEFKGSIGGSACILLARLKGDSVKDYLFDLIYSNQEDYNFLANGVSEALMPIIKKSNLEDIIKIINKVEESKSIGFDYSSVQGLITALSCLLNVLKFSDVKHALYSNSKQELTPLSKVILSRMVMENYSQDRLELASELLLIEPTAATGIYFIGSFGSEDYNWTIFGEEHLDKLIEYAIIEGSWAIKAISKISEKNDSFRCLLLEKSKSKNGILKAILESLYFNDSNIVIKEIDILSKKIADNQDDEYLFLIDEINIDWKGKEDLLSEILVSSSNRLLAHILHQCRDEDFGILTFQNPRIFLHKLTDYRTNKEIYWIGSFLSSIFNDHLTKDGFQPFIDEFNSSKSEHRDVLFDIILPQKDNLTTDDFSDDAISYILSRISKDVSNSQWNEGLLENACTQVFVTEYLLPLLSINEHPLSMNLRNILRTAGFRHGKRYISS